MTQSSTKLLANGSALRVVNLLAQIAVAFFLTPFVIHSLGDHMYGFWALVGTFIGYYGLMDLGLGAAVDRHAAAALGRGDREECGRVFNQALQLYSALGAIVLVVTVVVAFLSPRFAHSPQDATMFRDVILILGASVAIGFPVRAFNGLLNAELRLDLVAGAEIFCLLLRAALIVAVLLAGGSIVALAWATFVANLPRVGIYIFASRKQCPWLRFRAEPWFTQRTRSLLNYSGFALIIKLADQLRFEADAFVITAFVGLAAVTHFNIASLMVAYFTSMMIALVGTLMPWFSRLDGAGDSEAIQKYFFFSTKISICVCSFIGFGFIAWGKPFIARWMGPSYVDAYPCLVALTAGYLVALFQAPSVNLLFGIARHRIYAGVSLMEGVANLALSIELVKRWGILGVAVGTCVPMLATKLLFLPLYTCHVASIPFGRYLREVARSLAIAGSALVVPALISARFAAASYLTLTMVALASIACYGLVIAGLQFTRQEQGILRRALLPARFTRAAFAAAARLEGGR